MNHGACLNSGARSRRGRVRGFTLAEVVVSIVIMSILMLGLGSAILVASHALPDDQRPAKRIVASADVAERIVGELREAIWIREHTATSVEFTVADRTGDGLPERIRYAWDGTAGEPLTRRYNGGNVVDVLADVQEFDLDYEVAAVTEQYPGPPVESSEQLLSSHDPAEEGANYSIENKVWLGQFFAPALDADALGWSVTRVQFRARTKGPVHGVTAVQLRLADGGNEPVASVLEQQLMSESDLGSSYQWVEFAFSDVRGLSPGAGLCLTLVRYINDADLCEIRYDRGGGSGLLTTSDGEDGWSYVGSRAMRYYVYGKVATPGPPQTATRYYVTGVRIALRAGGGSATRIVTAAQPLNRPELLSGLWEADFDTDPTLDHNGDGQSDWLLRSAASFDTDSLSDGVWYVGQPNLDTQPSNDFTGLTTILVRFRCTGVGQSAVLWSNVDFSGGNFIPIIGAVALLADGTQTLSVYAGWPLGVPLAQVTGLSSDFVTLRLLVDPDLDTINIQVDGVDMGTSAYTPYPPTTDPHSATLTQWGGNAEFDYVSVRVSE